jgi:hypothetical protein
VTRPRPSRARVIAAAGVLVVACGLPGCRGADERPWALDQSPTMADGGESAMPPRIRLEPAHRQAIHEVAASLVGGTGAWDGRERLETGRVRWSDTPAAAAAAGGREGIECVIAEVLADGREGLWSFRLLTADGEPGVLRIGRSPEDGAITVLEASLGRRPEAEAMRRRASRLAEAFGEELARLAERPRFAEGG